MWETTLTLTQHWHIFKTYDALNSCRMVFLNGRPILTTLNPGCQIYVFYYFFLLIWIYYIINSVTIFRKKLAINFWRVTNFYCGYPVSLKNNIKKIYGSFSMQLYITYYPILQQYTLFGINTNNNYYMHLLISCHTFINPFFTAFHFKSYFDRIKIFLITPYSI